MTSFQDGFVLNAKTLSLQGCMTANQNYISCQYEDFDLLSLPLGFLGRGRSEGNHFSGELRPTPDLPALGKFCRQIELADRYEAVRLRRMPSEPTRY